MEQAPQKNLGYNGGYSLKTTDRFKLMRVNRRMDV